MTAKFKRGDEIELIVTGYRFPIGSVLKIMKVDSTLLDECIYDCCDNIGNCEWILQSSLKLANVKSNTMIQTKKQAVLDTANKLLKAQNTVTTLEIKAQAILDYPDIYWKQDFVHDEMDTLRIQGVFTIVSDNGTYRTYSAVNPQVSAVPQTTSPVVSINAPVAKTAKVRSISGIASISRRKAYELMTNNKGHFFTATFVKQPEKGQTVGDERTMNCQYLKGQQDNLALGYIKVKDAVLLAKMKKEIKETGSTTVKTPIRQINLQTIKSLKIAGNFYKIRK